ncbi:hypothetical protein GOV14_05070 [Candidatus Pacearchaeota archaeon]|nr:hypothetical protein [Candidatus Pacearchaeota archaeon]
MIEYIILALFLGILAGTFTGLIPGIHINLITVILLGLSATLLSITTPLILVIFIVSMSITHTFIDYIPSIFLGAPDEDSFLSILPGHQLLLKGRAYPAVILTLYGSLTALLIILIFTPLFLYILPKVYPFLSQIIWVILLIVSLYIILDEGGLSKKGFILNYNKKLWALIIFILAGFLGITTLNLNISQPLLPLLTGLFGASSIILSIKHKTKVPKQKIIPLKEIRLNKKSAIKATIGSIIASPFTAFLPGLGASTAAVIGKSATRIKDQREFLFLLGAINTIVMGLSFITLYAVGKTRTGAAIAVSQLIPELTHINLIYIIAVILFSGIIAAVITILLSKLIAKNIHRFNYAKISLVVLGILFFLVFLLSDMLNLIGGLIGLIVFITATALGLFAIQLGIKRIHLMGCLIIPIILFYLL